MGIAICATVISGLTLLQQSELWKQLDHDMAQGVVKLHSQMKKLHDKLHHKTTEPSQ